MWTDTEWIARYIEQRQRGDWPAITESSVSRVRQHIQSGTPYAVLTAWRHDQPRSRNQANMKAFEQSIKDIGLTHTHLRGVWHDDTGNLKREPSALVHGMSRHHAERLARRYGQDAYIYSGPEIGHRPHAYDLESGEVADLGDFHPGVSRYMSRVRGRPWYFEWADWRNRGFIGSLLLDRRLRQAGIEEIDLVSA
jgi:hypothetical protein